MNVINLAHITLIILKMEYIAEIREYKTEAITELTTEYECIDKVRFFSKLSVSFQEQVSKSS